MAKRLPRQTRLQIAAELQRDDEQGDNAEVEAAWRDEVVRRIQRYLDGETTMLDGDAVYQRLRAKYAP
ncbi:MAG: addiction module protein [Myxococcales bacterium]|nr:addiction module protein [Myxococcales bacterium]